MIKKGIMIALSTLVLMPIGIIGNAKTNENIEAVQREVVVENANDFNTKMGYAMDHDATYLGNNYYVDSKGIYYKAEYNQLIEKSIIGYQSGNHYKKHKFGSGNTALKLVVTRKYYDDKGDKISNLKGRYKHVKGSEIDEKGKQYVTLEFGEEAPNYDYDIANYYGDGNTSDNNEGKEWIFVPPQRGEDTFGVTIAFIEILVSVSKNYIQTDMFGGRISSNEEEKAKPIGQVHSNQVYYDVLYLTTKEEAEANT